ncbi:MAG: hypothetical protein ACTSVI_12715 [Promethearchaeota archaeon]
MASRKSSTSSRSSSKTSTVQRRSARSPKADGKDIVMASSADDSSSKGVIKQGSIASFMRKRTQLVGFDYGHFKHVQYVVEFLDNALDAIETFQWKNQDENLAYQLESQNLFDEWIEMENELMEATSQEVQGISDDYAAMFDSFGSEQNGDVSSVESSSTPQVNWETTIEKPKESTKVLKKSDIDSKIGKILESMESLISNYITLIMNEPVVIIKLSEVEDKSLVFIDGNKNARLYCFQVFDSGTGMNRADLGVFGIYLASSKSEKLKQTRGSQGFGSPSAFSDAQNTTGKPIQIITKHYKSDVGYLAEFFTTGENKKSYTIPPTEVDVDFPHGTFISLYYTNIKYNRGYVDAYIKQTALMNSHVNIIYHDPYNDTHFYKRLVNDFPAEPKYAKAHPSSINIGDFQDKLRTSEYSTLKQFFTNSFVRISDKVAQSIIKNTENELQDRIGFLKLTDSDFITYNEKMGDYIYVLRKEKRVRGRSSRKRDTWVAYMLNQSKEEVFSQYKELHYEYKDCLSKISKIEKQQKDLDKKKNSLSTKKEKRELDKKIRELNKEKSNQEKVKLKIKEKFLKFINDNPDAFEEINDQRTLEILDEKRKIVNVSKASPRELKELQINTLYKFFTLEKYLAPPTDTAIPVGADVLESVLIQEFDLRISKFDQFFGDETLNKITNDQIQLPRHQEEIKKSIRDEIDDDIKHLEILKLPPEQFVEHSIRLILKKFTQVVSNKKLEIKPLLKYNPEAYKHHYLYAEEIIEEDLDFACAITRPPTSGKGLAFVVEAAIAYGKNIKPPAKASDAVFRFVNRTPKLRDNTDCAIWKAVQSVNWKNYMLDTFDNGIPKGPVRVFVNVSGPFVHLMFKSQSKQALAEDENLMKEIKLALEQVGRKLRAYLSKKQKHIERKKRESKFIKFAPLVSRSIINIISRIESDDQVADAEVLEEKLIQAIGKRQSTESGIGQAGPQVAFAKGKTKTPTRAKENASKKEPAAASKAETAAKAPVIEERKKSTLKTKDASKKVTSPTKKPTTSRSTGEKQQSLIPRSSKSTSKVTKGKTTPKKKLESKEKEITTPLKISEENILKVVPSDKWVRIGYIIKKMGIKDLTDARFLELKLKALVKNKRIEKNTQGGKSHYKKVE